MASMRLRSVYIADLVISSRQPRLTIRMVGEALQTLVVRKKMEPSRDVLKELVSEAERRTIEIVSL